MMVTKKKKVVSVSLPVEEVASRILVIRGEKVMIDADLAELYGVATKALNQAVKRNSALPDRVHVSAQPGREG